MSKGHGPRAIATIATTWPNHPDHKKQVTIEGGKLGDKVGSLSVQGDGQLAWFTRDELVALRDQLTAWIEDGDGR